MPTTITSSGITFNDATSQTTSALAVGAIGNTQLADGSVNLQKIESTTQLRVAKAWVNFNGATSPGTIRSSLNISSVVHNGTGDWTINFSNSITNYVVSGVAESTNISSATAHTGHIVPVNGGIQNNSLRVVSGVTSGYTNAYNYNTVMRAIFGN